MAYLLHWQIGRQTATSIEGHQSQHSSKSAAKPPVRRIGKRIVMQGRNLRQFVGIGALLLWSASVPAVQAQSDPGKKACAKEARLLCPAEMKSMSRKKVEACMIVKIAQTSPVCHAAMLRIKAERERTVKR
jgi:hypothetical protein